MDLRNELLMSSNDPLFESIVDLISSRTYKSGRRDSGGTTLVAKRTDRIPGEEGWFHTIYSPLDQAGVRSVARDLGSSFWRPPEVEEPPVIQGLGWFAKSPYGRLLTSMNGGRFFASHLNLYGVVRDNPWSTTQPLALADSNRGVLSAHSASSRVVFGGYRWDGSEVVCGNGSDRIKRVSVNGEILNWWADLASFIREEFQRLDALFDDEFKLRPDVESTAPDVFDG